MKFEGQIINTATENDKSKLDNIADDGHQEAIDFIERNRDLFEHYARGKVKFLPAPLGLDTFAFNLETKEIYINSRFYKNKGLSEERTTFATLHEIEHLLEDIGLLAEKGGAKVFEKYIAQIKESKAYGLMDNCLADIRENSAVVDKTNRSFSEIEVDLYKQDLFPDTDFTKFPRHIQLPQALLRESRVKGEECLVSPDVRAEIDALKSIVSKDGTKLLEIMADPETAMSTRLKLQNKYIWPIIEKLRDRDMEDDKKSKDGKGKKDINDSSSNTGVTEEGGEGEALEETGINPNEVFKEDYEEAQKRVPNAVPIEKIEEALKEWKKGEENTDDVQNADRQYAEQIGVKVEDLQKYRKIVDELSKAVNPETNEKIIDELRQIIERIISKRLKPKHAPRYPVEEGDELVDPVQLITDARAGNFEPKVWETVEVRNQKGNMFGEVEITLVCDRSGSMMQPMEKLTEQRKAAIFLMEALKEFSDRAKEEEINLENPIEVRSEVYSFQKTSDDSKPLKQMSSELGERERIEAMVKISTAPGNGTTDFITLENIRDGLDQDTLEKIKDGQLKKIVIVFTDGESDSVSRVKSVLEDVRGKGVIVVGVGITENGKSALTTYSPGAHLAPQAEKLSTILAEILKDHLSDI